MRLDQIWDIYLNIMILLNMIMVIIWKDIKIMLNHNVLKLFRKELPGGSLVLEFHQLKKKNRKLLIESRVNLGLITVNMTQAMTKISYFTTTTNLELVAP